MLTDFPSSQPHWLRGFGFTGIPGAPFGLHFWCNHHTSPGLTLRSSEIPTAINSSSVKNSCCSFQTDSPSLPLILPRLPFSVRRHTKFGRCPVAFKGFSSGCQYPVFQPTRPGSLKPGFRQLFFRLTVAQSPCNSLFWSKIFHYSRNTAFSVKVFHQVFSTGFKIAQHRWYFIAYFENHPEVTKSPHLSHYQV